MSVYLSVFSFTQAMRARDTILTKIGECLDRNSDDVTANFTSVLLLLLQSSPENGEEPLTGQEVREAALELLFAGHETTASAACSILMHLANKVGYRNFTFSGMRF